MNTIRFANGEVHDCSFISTHRDGEVNKVVIALVDVSFSEAADIFSDPRRTSEMICGNLLMVDYIEPVMLGVQPYGIQAVLKGGYNERIN